MSIPQQVILPGLTPGFRLSSSGETAFSAASSRNVLDMTSILVEVAQAPSENRLESLVAAVIRDIDSLELDRVILVGEGFSATLALQVAARHPERVEQLFLSAPVGYISPLSGGRRTPMTMPEVIRHLYSGNDQQVRDAVRVLAGGAVKDVDALADRYVIESSHTGVREAAEALATWMAAGEFDLTARPEGDGIREIKQQVTLVWGRDDLWACVDSAFYLSRRLRNVRLRIFPHCGHLLSHEASARVERHRDSVLSGTSTAAAGVGVSA